MSSPLSSDLAVPVPKPRARYQRAGLSLQVPLSADRDLMYVTPDAATTGHRKETCSMPNLLAQDRNEDPASFLHGSTEDLHNAMETGVSPTSSPTPYTSLPTPSFPTPQPAVPVAATPTPTPTPRNPPLRRQSAVTPSCPVEGTSTSHDHPLPACPSAPPDPDPHQPRWSVSASPPSSPVSEPDLDPYTTVVDPSSESSNDDDSPVVPSSPVAPSSPVVPSSPVAPCPPMVPQTEDAVPAELTSLDPTNRNIGSPRVGLVPCRPAPPPPVDKTALQTRPLKQKTPRAATIRVSRKKQGAAVSSGGGMGVGGGGGVVSRSSWLDVWKGRKYNVLWATLDGQLMSLWKKRTDKFTEMVFHVSNITNVRQQEKGRFSLYFRKKHYQFMAHNNVVQEGWVTSLLAARGCDPPAPPEQHGSLTMKDPRHKVYAAVTGHKLWLYHNKEDFQLGVGMMYVSMNVASVKQTGKHSFTLITPYKTFNFSVDSTRDLGVWLGSLNQVIRSALSCSQVALRLWASPWNKVCADCGSANPEWASVNLLVVICEACAGLHRSLGINSSKVRSLTLDSKVWTEPLIQLFVHYGNKAANDVWGQNVPAVEQILSDASVEQRGEFIRSKYTRGRYRRAHPLASSQKLLNQRLCEVVCGDNILETLSLLCSGARVLCHSGDPLCPSPISLAERAGQAMQTELLRHNEYTEAPAHDHQKPNRGHASSDPSAAGEEELHGKLEEDRFLFSQENEAAACDVLDLREVISIFHHHSTGETHEFEIVTLTDKLLCSSDTHATLLSHLIHILKVVLPGKMEEEELAMVFAVSRVSLREGGGLQHTEVWAGLQGGRVLLYPTDLHGSRDRLDLDTHTRYNLDSSENTIELVTGDRSLSLQFEETHSCQSWYRLLQWALSPAERRLQQYGLPPGSVPPGSVPPSSVPPGNVPPGVERCISHINQHGLKVDGLYRRCGIATNISRLVEALIISPGSAHLETDEQGLLDAAGALKQYVRKQVALIPHEHKELWIQASGHPEEAVRLAAYRTLLRQMPPDNRVTLNALCGHFYLVQMYSGENRMTAQNLALVFVPTLFQELALNTNMVRLTRELIIHHTLLFLQDKAKDLDSESEELITVF